METDPPGKIKKRQLYIMLELLHIRKSKNKTKKWVAVFKIDNDKEKRVRFGATGYTDYTLGASKKQRDNYRNRHKNDNINVPLSPGSLSYYILWDTPDMDENIKKFKKRFNV
tara:strand:+ start:44 stop:379 length:336 start_codon:yes stop_codon:yes gene_type:complete